MKPPSVKEVMNPRSHRIKSTTAMVVNIIFYLSWCPKVDGAVGQILLRGHSVELGFLGYSFSLGVADDAVLVVSGGVEGVELQVLCL